ncbi:hypothetical protein DFM93_005441, partial [Clostridium beijerinckii]|nr:hypothetical protein [Clostridium beijerinckii]
YLGAHFAIKSGAKIIKPIIILVIIMLFGKVIDAILFTSS